jgi:hypothetical protein
MQRANQEYSAAVARASTYLPSTHHALHLNSDETEALHAQISETLRGILSDDEYAAEAPG